MASNDVEVLDPAAPVEKSTPSGFELDRRHFIAALGVAGAAAGTALISSSKAEAQQPTPNGYAQVDVINLMLQVKYLKATLYSYITQGSDLPGSSQVTVGSGAVYNAPAKISFSSQQITDLFNEMYYDELNQLIALRAIQGIAVAPRQTVNLLGTGPSGTAPSSATTTLTQSQAIALARLLEDLSVSAFATATVYLTGANLALAAQALASDGTHAGAVRLLAIQNGVQYQGAQFSSVAPSNTSQSAVTFGGLLTAGNPLIYAMLPANVPVVGSVATGNGIPSGAGAVITAVTPTANAVLTAITGKTSPTLTFVSSVAGLAVGQPITGTFIPAGTSITAIGTNTLTLSANATAASQVTPTGFVTSGSPTVTGVSSVTGLIKGQPITGTGIPTTPATTITDFSATALTITMSANANATSTLSFTGTLTSGSPTITNISTINGLVIGQPITGTSIPAGATITAVSATSLTMSANATARSSAASVSTPTTETLTSPTTETVTVGLTQITLAGVPTVSGLNTISIVVADPQDVEPGDPGTAALSATGPTTVAGTSPAIYQGFFNTAGGSTPTAFQPTPPNLTPLSTPTPPAGFAFARSFQQVLAVLYGYNNTNSVIATQNFEGGFYPFGVSGQITSAI